MTTNIKLPKAIEPLDGETVLARRWANHTLSKLQATGGRLYLTNYRVLFCPHAFDAALNRPYWWAPFAAITEVGREKKSLRNFTGGVRDRLKISLNDGATELFVINKLNDVIDEIQATMADSH